MYIYAPSTKKAILCKILVRITEVYPRSCTRLESTNDFKVETHNLFVDYEAVYDSIHRLKLSNTQLRRDCTDIYRILAMTIYECFVLEKSITALKYYLKANDREAYCP